jgi:ubiquinone/menaquinone biosynthesis C-methylase UbiE
MTDEEARMRKATEAIRGNFDRGAESYAGFEERNTFFAELLKELMALSPLPVGGRVLDVGCGTGASLAGLLKAVGDGGEVVGIDLSSGMLEEARARLGPEVKLLCGDGCAYGDMVEPGFDAVVYNAVLFLLPDAESSLQSALKVLRPGGALLISNLDRVTLDGVVVAELLSREGHKAGRHSLSPWTKVQPLVERYFTDLKEKTLDLPLSPELFTGFYGMEPMSAGLLPRLPYPERRAIVEALGARWRDEGKAPIQRWMLLTARKPER